MAANCKRPQSIEPISSTNYVINRRRRVFNILSLLISTKPLGLLAMLLATIMIDVSEQAATGQLIASSTGKGYLMNETILFTGNCAAKVSCEMQKGRIANPESGIEKRSCYCDNQCSLYDDCCLDSQYTDQFDARISSGFKRLKQTRGQWFCHQVNPVFGDVLLKASCSDDWSKASHWPDEEARKVAESIKRNCEYIRQKPAKGSSRGTPDDPVGMMLPITDLSSGITYANSYCLRCNKLTPIQRPPKPTTTARKKQESQPTQPKLMYWSPMLECNYDLNTDDRNVLYDLISAHKGKVLQYSSERNKWLIDTSLIPPQSAAAAATMAPVISGNRTNDQDPSNSTLRPTVERECGISPSIPEGLEQTMHYCKSNMIDTCPNSTVLFSASQVHELERARLECQYGHQALAYGQTSGAIYYNSACAKCNNEKQVSCSPKFSTSFKILSIGVDLDSTAGRSGSGNPQPTSISGSFSVLLDLYGGWHGNEQVGAVHQCPDAVNQVYDPFFLRCRDIVCGLNHRYVDGRCVAVKANQEDNLHVNITMEGNKLTMSATRDGDHHVDNSTEIYPITSERTPLRREDQQQGDHLTQAPVNGMRDTESQASSTGLQMADVAANQHRQHPTHLTQTTASAEGLVHQQEPDSNSSLPVTTAEPTTSTGRSLLAVAPDQPASTANPTESGTSSSSSLAGDIVTEVGIIGQDQLLPGSSTDLNKIPSEMINGGNGDLGGAEDENEATGEPMSAKLKATATTMRTTTASNEQIKQIPKETSTLMTNSGHENGFEEDKAAKNDHYDTGRNNSSANAERPPIEPVESALESARFETTLAGLDASKLPQPTVESRQSYIECGKILIEPEHYRLFTTVLVEDPSDAATIGVVKRQQRTLAENGSSTSDTGSRPSSNLTSGKIILLTLDEWLQQQHANGRRHLSAGGNKLWAFVLPYNLTLASSQFELVRSTVPVLRRETGEVNATTWPGGKTNNDRITIQGTNIQQPFKLLVCSPFRTDLVAKFEPAMANLTSICLVISITSLSMYLLLYCLSMFDLRHLVVEMAQAGLPANCMLNENPLDKLRGSRASNDLANSTGSTAAKSQSLSSRGVACLAGSLLAAYLLFIFGHQQANRGDAKDERPLISCDTVAVATYYCFLVAFSWMFLLSYDIWRTLRLATCQLRGPVLHSQSKRFIAYTVVAFGVSALIVGSALLVDNLEPYKCNRPDDGAANDQQCSQTMLDFNQMIDSYKPQFGQRPGSCWFQNRRALALFFGLPVTLIMLANLLFFIHSSYMIVRTSSRSTRRSPPSTNSSGYSSSPPAGHKQNPFTMSTPNDTKQDYANSRSQDSQQQDYTQQNSLTTNSMISVQTCQSNLSASSKTLSLASQSSNGYQFESCNQTLTPEGATRLQLERANSFDEEAGRGADDPNHQYEEIQRRKLESSLSSSSLTNQSVGTASMTNSFVAKYDTHLHNLSSVMGTIVKDYRLYCRLSTIMGLTWLVGLMASIVDQSHLLWYLFVVLNTLQGLFIFIAFGCKRSKLSNLEILLHYILFKWNALTKNQPARDQVRTHSGTNSSACTGCKMDNECEQGKPLASR